MKNYSGRRICSMAVALLGLSAGVHSTGFAQVAASPAAYTGALSYDVMSMPAMGNEQFAQQADGITSGTNTAYTAALADGITTGIGISAGAVEMNPLVSPSPLGVLAMTGLKIGLIKYAETLPEQDKRITLKASSAIWSGAAVNNLLVLAAAPTPISILAGLMMGVAAWMHMDNQYQEQDRLAALRAAQPLSVAAAPAAIPVADSDSSDVVAVEARGELSSGE